MPESTVATNELVVPRSMPTIRLTPGCCHEPRGIRTQFSIFIFRQTRQFHPVPAKRQRDVEDRFVFERTLLFQGARRIAGVDEAGRGPLAGPVIAAAVILPVDWMKAGLPA